MASAQASPQASDRALLQGWLPSPLHAASGPLHVFSSRVAGLLTWQLGLQDTTVEGVIPLRDQAPNWLSITSAIFY